MIHKADKFPADDADDEERQEKLSIYRKIAVLSCVPCCGICGTMRLATKPFWCLGMRICKHCVSANLVSNLVLYERLWVAIPKPVQGHSSFVDAIVGKVFYFSNRLTPHQRLEFSTDRIDFPGGLRNIWWFWKPHLEKALNMEELAKEASLKHKAAATVVGVVRRALVLRILSGAKDITSPTTVTPLSTIKRRDKRSAFFRLKKIELLDRIDGYHEQRLLLKLNSSLATRMNHYDDRIFPWNFK